MTGFMCGEGPGLFLRRLYACGSLNFRAFFEIAPLSRSAAQE